MKNSEKLQKIKDSHCEFLFTALLIAHEECAFYEEIRCEDSALTAFIFIYPDGSELKIDTEGDVYFGRDYENAFNIFEER